MVPGSQRDIVRISAPANLLGALVTYGYFRFIDPPALAQAPRLGPGEILYFVVGFGGLVLVGYWLGPGSCTPTCW